MAFFYIISGYVSGHVCVQVFTIGRNFLYDFRIVSGTTMTAIRGCPTMCYQFDLMFTSILSVPGTCTATLDRLRQGPEEPRTRYGAHEACQKARPREPNCLLLLNLLSRNQTAATKDTSPAIEH